MSGLFLPFNFRPAGTVRINGSYTVPANQYALISYTLSCSSRTSSFTRSGLNDTEYSAIAIDTPSASKDGQFWAKPGDVINFSSNAPNASASRSFSSSATDRSGISEASDVAFVQITLNGNLFANCTIGYSVAYDVKKDYTNNSSSVSGSTTITLTATNSGSAIVQLFDIP